MGESYPSAEMQSVYFAAPDNRRKTISICGDWSGKRLYNTNTIALVILIIL